MLPLHDTISRQAYALWERYGRPDGRDVAIWLEAERQVLGTDDSVRAQEAGPAPAGSLADSLYPNRQPDAGVDGEPVALPPNGDTPRRR